VQLEKLISLKEVKMEGIRATPHNIFVQREMGRRKEAMKYIKDASKLAKYLDGTVEPLQREEGWIIEKEFFPGVEIYLIYRYYGEEGSTLQALYYGGKILENKIPGEDLAEMTVAFANHILRYIREENSEIELPQICYQV
jgi:hypothetical protein